MKTTPEEWAALYARGPRLIQPAEGRAYEIRPCSFCGHEYRWYPPKDASAGPCCLTNPATPWRNKPLADPSKWRAS